MSTNETNKNNSNQEAEDDDDDDKDDKDKKLTFFNGNTHNKKKTYEKDPLYDGLRHDFVKNGKEIKKIVKLFAINSIGEMSNWLYEIYSRKLLQKIDNEIAHLIVSATPCVIDVNKVGIKMHEYDGDLMSSCPLASPEILNIFNTLVKFVYVLQSHSLIWIDFKCEQFIYNKTTNNLRIVDFEDMQTYDIWKKHKANYGTMHYLAPEERLFNDKNNFTSYCLNSNNKDTLCPAAITTFKLGLMLLVLAICPEDEFFISSMWSNESSFNTLISRTILEGKKIVDKLSNEFWEFVEKCLSYHAKDRPINKDLINPSNSWYSLLKPSISCLQPTKITRSYMSAPELASLGKETETEKIIFEYFDSIYKQDFEMAMSMKNNYHDKEIFNADNFCKYIQNWTDKKSFKEFYIFDK